MLFKKYKVPGVMKGPEIQTQKQKQNHLWVVYRHQHGCHRSRPIMQDKAAAVDDKQVVDRNARHLQTRRARHNRKPCQNFNSCCEELDWPASQLNAVAAESRYVATYLP